MFLSQRHLRSALLGLTAFCLLLAEVAAQVYIVFSTKHFRQGRDLSARGPYLEMEITFGNWRRIP